MVETIVEWHSNFSKAFADCTAGFEGLAPRYHIATMFGIDELQDVVHVCRITRTFQEGKCKIVSMTAPSISAVLGAVLRLLTSCTDLRQGAHSSAKSSRPLSLLSDQSRLITCNSQ
eukprot:14116037-Heterocapsa_arctica.AAC.1